MQFAFAGTMRIYIAYVLLPIKVAIMLIRRVFCFSFEFIAIKSYDFQFGIV